MATPTPLTEDDLTDINKALVSSEEADALIEMSARAGIDVGEFRERSKVARDKLLRIKSTFFPGK